MNVIYSTLWGCDEVSVSANWADASCPVEGDAHGRQVAHFGHDGLAALRAALEDCASLDGLTGEESAALITAALMRARKIDAEGIE